MHSTGEKVGRFEKLDDIYKNEWLNKTGTPPNQYRNAYSVFDPRCYYIGETYNKGCDNRRCKCPCHTSGIPEGLV